MKKLSPEQRAARARQSRHYRKKRVQWLCDELDRIVQKAEGKPAGSKFRPLLMAEADQVRAELRELDH